MALQSTPIAVLLERLSNVRQSENGQYYASCPAHPDRHPSLALRELGDGRVLLFCLAGCSADAVMAAVGLGLRDLYPAPQADAGPVPYGARWDWRGLLLMLAQETHVVMLAVSDLAAGRSLSETDCDRLRTAAARIARTAELAK